MARRGLPSLAAYTLIVVVSIACIVALLRYGATLHAIGGQRDEPATGVSELAPCPVQSGHGRPPVATLLAQIVVIVLMGHLFRRIIVRFGQPPVIGEIVAGLMLGPSVLGAVWPQGMTWLFPLESLGTLKLLAEIGVILFMFIVGMDVHVEHLKRRAHTTVLVSHASIIIPFLLGSGLAVWIYPTMAAPGVTFVAFALFMSIGMSITAFPVLARIIDEKGLKGTTLGATAITCAAIDDVTAWCLLALVIAIVNSASIAAVLVTVSLTIFFALGMLFFVAPAFARWTARHAPPNAVLSNESFSLILALILLSSLATESIGIHSLFGAFLAGIVIPKSAHFRTQLREKLESFAAVGLLPIFFAYTGLRTHVGLLYTWDAVVVGLAVLFLAVVGKLAGSMMAARFSGMDWRTSFALGALMNTRGLVELIVLNIGYDLGVLSQRIFAIMVLMALITTFMTGPLLGLVLRTTEPLTATIGDGGENDPAESNTVAFNGNRNVDGGV